MTAQSSPQIAYCIRPARAEDAPAIYALLATRSPYECGFILLDPKKVELVQYARLPHVLRYASEPSDMVAALQFALQETDRRFTEMQHAGVRGYSGPDLYVIIDELAELSDTVKTNSLCALGQTASNPISSTIAHFKDEYLAHIQDKKCPAHVCKNLMEYYIDPEKCIGCGMCARGCPANCIQATDYTAPGHKRPSMKIDASQCVKCGACISTCKFKAIEKR